MTYKQWHAKQSHGRRQWQQASRRMGATPPCVRQQHARFMCTVDMVRRRTAFWPKTMKHLARTTQHLSHDEVREAMVRWIDEDLMPHFRKGCMAWLDEDLMPQVHAEAKRLGFTTNTVWTEPCSGKPCAAKTRGAMRPQPPSAPPPAHMLAKAKPMRRVPPCPPPPSASHACEVDHVDPPEAKKLRVDHGEAAKKKTCPLKSKAKPPEHARPVEPGPVKQDHENDDNQEHGNDEDDVQGDHDSSSPSRGQGAPSSKADTGSTMDAEEGAKDVMTTKADKDVVDKVDMKAALRRTMNRQEIKEDLQKRLHVNYAPFFKAHVAPRIMGGLVPWAAGKDPFAPGKE